MSCVLRITGTKKLDIDKLQKDLNLNPYKIDRVGEPFFENRPDKGINILPGLSFDVSHADFSDFQKQIKDAIKFLTKNESHLKAIKSNKAVTSATLDFGIDSRIDKNIIVQTDHLPAKLLKLSGNLNIDIELSHYANIFYSDTKKTKKLRPQIRKK